MPYLVRARFLLAVLAGGLWLIAFNAYAQSSGAGRASHSIWELAVDHMLFGGQLSQGDREFIYRLGQTAPPLGAEIGIPDNTPSACQYVEYAQNFSQDLIDFPNILLCRAPPVGAQNSLPPDLRMLLNLDLFRPQLQLDKPRHEDSSPDTSMLDQIRTLNALGYLDGDTYMNAGAKAAASDDEQPPAPVSSQEPPK